MESWRVTTPAFWGITVAQVISLALILGGLVGVLAFECMFLLKRKGHAGILVALLSVSAFAQDAVLEFEGSHQPAWHLKGSSPFLIGGYGHNFVYDGSNVVPLEGEAHVIVDANTDTGTMTVVVEGTIHPERDKTYTGRIELVYRVGHSDGPAFQEGGVADFIYVHGDTEQGPPVMPRTRAFLAGWAAADLYVNGELVYEGLDGHMMYTERSRDTTTQAVYADAERTTFYSPMEPSKGYIVDPEGRDLHFVAHSLVEDPDNFPGHTVWIHLNFEEVVEVGTPTAVGYGTWGRIKASFSD